MVLESPTAALDAFDPSSLESLFVDDWDPSDQFDLMCRYAIIPAGKLFRPYLLLEACAAVGGDINQAIPAALGAEYGHVASLVHDDIIDGDLLRRGRPSVHAEFGRDHAIVIGDALIFRLFLALSECAERGAVAERVVASLRAVALAGVDLCRGQASETRLCGDAGAGLDDYLVTVRGKTGALFRGACEVGALLGGGDKTQVSGLATYGEQLGVAFQMVDDLLPYQSTSGTAGKNLLSDLRNRRMTFPLIVACLASPDEVRPVLQGVFDRIGTQGWSAEEEPQTLETIVTLLERVAALNAATKIVSEHAARAADALEVLPSSPSRDRLAAMLVAAVQRVA